MTTPDTHRAIDTVWRIESAKLIGVWRGRSSLCFREMLNDPDTVKSKRVMEAMLQLALYEPPFIVDDSRPPLPKNYIAQLNALVSSGRRGDAVEFFMTKAVGVPDELLAQMRDMPMWAEMEKVAHTLAYDGKIMGDNVAGHSLQTKQWASVTVPTLVMDGGASPAWARNAVQALADALPNAQRRTLEDQTHGVDPAVLAPVLVESLTS